jgi:copper homeostasis protein CutC
MAYTQEQLDEIEKLIASGVTKVKTADGKEVEYGSVEKLKQIRDDIKRELAGGPSSGIVKKATRYNKRLD